MTICQDCWEPVDENPLCICRAIYEPCPGCGLRIFTTPRQALDPARTCASNPNHPPERMVIGSEEEV